LSLDINLPKRNEIGEEDFDINFNLKLEGDNLSSLEIPCTFKFILSQLELKIECLNYELIIKDNNLQLGLLFLEENEIIDFRVQFLNDNTKIKINIKVSYKSNKENEAKRPKLIQKKNNFRIEISNEYNDIDITEPDFKIKRFSSKLYIYL